MKGLRCSGSLIARAVLAGLSFATLSGLALGQPAAGIDLRLAFDHGKFAHVAANAPEQIARYRRMRAYSQAAENRVIAARALIHLERYDEAGKMLDEALSDAKNIRAGPARLALVLFSKAALLRTKRDFKEAVRFSKEALAAAPNDQQVVAEYHLAIGRIMYSAGYDVAAIVWLEKVEGMLPPGPVSELHLDVWAALKRAWSSKLYQATAISYAMKSVQGAENTRFRYRHQLALYDLATILNATGQRRKARLMYEQGRDLSTKANDEYQSSLFLSTLLLNSLYDGDVPLAEKHLQALERIDATKRFAFEILLGKSVIDGLRGRSADSELQFEKLRSVKGYSEYYIPNWKATIAERSGDWENFLKQNSILRDLAERDNFREDLPGIYFNLARGYRARGRREDAHEYLRKAASMIDEARLAADAPVSLPMLEVHHSIYRLQAETAAENDVHSSFEIADHLKAMVLKDRIENSVARRRPDIPTAIRERAEQLSKQFVEGAESTNELELLEKAVTTRSSTERETRPRLDDLNRVIPEGTAIVSYIFTIDGKLLAYVKEKGKPVLARALSVSEADSDLIAEEIRRKIRDRIFFKKDGKEIYDKLLAPLSLETDHIIVVPDKTLWKIPFQALSPDGKTYLIEQKTISYAPSVAILGDMFTLNTPVRKTAQVFANDTYDKRYLPYVNREAVKVARIFGVQPLIGATPRQFRNSAAGSDIVHFSMHAQADAEDPLGSFLAFKADGSNPGRVTVGDLLNVRLKKQSLAFLASCQTATVLSGEGLVSIAWALLGSGSSSVISAQWEANDRSTEIFTEEFYRRYREGASTAKAMQAASIAMIENKLNGSHEPYFWAAFALLGDHR